MKIRNGRIYFDSEVKWGGARKGAGRKRKLQPPAERKNYSAYIAKEFYDSM